MRIVLDYFFVRQAVVVMAVDAQAVYAALFLSGSLSGPEKWVLGIVHQVAAGAHPRLQSCLIFDVCSFGRCLAQIMFGIGDKKFIAVARGADFRRRLPDKKLAGGWRFGRPMGIVAGGARDDAVLILQSDFVKKRQVGFVLRPDRQRMLGTGQNGFACDVALAVTAQAQLGGKTPCAGKFSGRLVRQMAGRTNAGLGHRIVLKIFFLRPGTLQVVLGIVNRPFVRMAVQAKGRFLIGCYQQGRPFRPVLMNLMAGQAY